VSAPGETLRFWRPESTWRLARLLIEPWLIPTTRLRVYGAERVPLTGACVLAANHIAAVDPFVLGTSSPRTIRFMAKVELWRVPVVRSIIEHTGAFPVRRGQPDRAALQAARDVLRAGEMLGVFVEGTRQPTDEVGAARAGAAMLAVGEGAPILPVYIHGTDQHDRFGTQSVTISYGTPMTTTHISRSGRAYRDVGDLIETELRRLREFTLAAVHAGRPRRGLPPITTLEEAPADG
jgi:1-acyl-sn-glycerol-3-phosphate acyltransferase